MALGLQRSGVKHLWNLKWTWILTLLCSNDVCRSCVLSCRSSNYDCFSLPSCIDSVHFVSFGECFCYLSFVIACSSLFQLENCSELNWPSLALMASLGLWVRTLTSSSGSTRSNCCFVKALFRNPGPENQFKFLRMSTDVGLMDDPLDSVRWQRTVIVVDSLISWCDWLSWQHTHGIFRRCYG